VLAVDGTLSASRPSRFAFPPPTGPCR
jgi:hypothetical protein